MKLKLSQITLFLTACCGLSTNSELAVQCGEPTKETTFKSVFNGRDLTGWRHGDNWTVSKGEVICSERGADLTLATKMPDDFELWFEWMVAKGGEKGTTQPPQEDTPDGLFSLTYRAIPRTDLTHGQNKVTYSGEVAYGYSVGGGCVALSTDAVSPLETGSSTTSLFYTVTPSKKASRPAGQWNEGRIVRTGGLRQHWLNGEKVVDIDLNSPLQPKENDRLRVLANKLGSHGLYLQFKDDAGSLHFRNVKLKTLSP